MSVVSKLTFVPFTPPYTDSTSWAYHSDRDMFRGELRVGLNTIFALITGVVDKSMYYSKEQYARIVVWCLGVLLDGWPAHIPFTNLSNIKGGITSLRLLRDLLRDGKLKFIPAPPDVRQRALHDPESVLPHIMSAAKLPPLPLTITTLKFSESRFRDLMAPHAKFAPLLRRQPVATSTRANPPAPAEERVLHPDTLEPVLATPIGPGSSRQPCERRQRSDVNKARHRPISNPDGKPMHTRKVGALTSNFVLDRPTGPSVASTSGGRVMKRLSELRMPVMVNDNLSGYVTPGGDDEEVDDIESFTESEDESERRNRAKRQRYL